MRLPRGYPTYPMGDNEDFYFGTDNDVNQYWDGTYLTFRGVNAELNISFATAGVTSIYGGITAGDDLTLVGSTADAYPKIVLRGGSNPIIYTPYATDLVIYNTTTQALTMTWGAAEYTIENKVNNSDTFLKCTGAGVLKFGTYTAGAALASIGYITTKDAAGNTIKLMVQA